MPAVHRLSEPTGPGTADCATCGPVAVIIRRRSSKSYRQCPTARTRESVRERDWSQRRGTHGLRYSEAAALREGKLCALCCTRPAQVVDHCHATGRIRGVLCKHCNAALGKLGDTPESIERVLAYVRG